MSYFIDWKQDEIIKYTAQKQFAYAVRKGRVERSPCFICGTGKVVGHHWDYTKPLDVFWLCHKHHVEVHTGKIKLPLPDKPKIPAGPWRKKPGVKVVKTLCPRRPKTVEPKL